VRSLYFGNNKKPVPGVKTEKKFVFRLSGRFTTSQGEPRGLGRDLFAEKPMKDPFLIRIKKENP